MNLGIVFLNERIAELLRVNLLLTSLTTQSFRMLEAYWNKTLLAPDKERNKVFVEVLILGFQNDKSINKSSVAKNRQNWKL